MDFFVQVVRVVVAAPAPGSDGEVAGSAWSHASRKILATTPRIADKLGSVFRRLKQTVRRFPGLHATEQFVREMGRAVRRAVRPPPDSPVERVLCAYGLDNQADALRSRRLTQLRQSRTTRRAASG